jgi:ATP:corrinoid adenosyltransferase
MYSQERELKKLRVTVHNKARVDGCIVEAFACKEIMNFLSKYFSRTNNVNAHMAWYHIVEEVLLSELSIYAHYVMYDEWNYTILYMYTNMEEV